MQSQQENLLDPASQSLSEALNLSLKILKIIMIVLLLAFLGTGIFIVKKDEVAVVLRFGKIKGNMSGRILKPGLHWAWPYPISEVKRLKIKKVHVLELKDFWYQQTPEDAVSGSRKPPETLDPELNGYTLTRDACIVHSQWKIEYVISNPEKFWAAAKRPQEVLRQVATNCILHATSHYAIDDILKHKEELSQLTHRKINGVLATVDIGIKVESISIPHLQYPRQVKEAFDSIVRDQMLYNNKVEQAYKYRDKVIGDAQGKTKDIRRAAESYKQDIITRTKSDAIYFTKILEIYKQYPEIFRERLYQQVVEKIEDRVQEMFFFQARSDIERELRYRIGRNPELNRMKPGEQEKKK